MSKEEWFRNFERLRNEGIPEKEAVERARQMQRSILDRADELKKKERGE